MFWCVVGYLIAFFIAFSLVFFAAFNTPFRHDLVRIVGASLFVGFIIFLMGFAMFDEMG